MKGYDYSEYVESEWRKPLLGRTIVNIRQLQEEEYESFGWYHGGSDPAIVVFLDDGSFFIPAADPELNGPGFLLVEPVETVK
jgi:hypothetical protein